MKYIKFSVLTICLICISSVLITLAVALEVLGTVANVVGATSVHVFFHHMTVQCIDLNLRAFDDADAVMRHRKITSEFDRPSNRNFSVAYFDSKNRHMASNVCRAHCSKCAAIVAYDDSAAGYETVAVEAI